jgi:hypothetical protein
MEIRKTRKNIIKTLIIYPALPASTFNGASDGKK